MKEHQELWELASAIYDEINEKVGETHCSFVEQSETIR
jgi:hypothetical protein